MNKETSVQRRLNKEQKTFDEKFIWLDSKKLCELISAADILKLRPLVDLTASALAGISEGETAEQMRETFHIINDLTEEEKLEPLKIRTNDTNSISKYRTYSGFTSHIISYHKVLYIQSNQFVLTFLKKSYNSTHGIALVYIVLNDKTLMQFWAMVSAT